MIHRTTGAAIAVLIALSCGAAQAQVAGVSPDGAVTTTTAVTVPISPFLSAQGQAELKARLLRKPPGDVSAGIGPMREAVRARQREDVARWLAIYPADIVPTMIGGVQTDVVTPKAGVAKGNEHRVLINLHGGGFLFGAREGGQAEAIPLAGTGRIKVVTVDYRMAPEHTYPAASEDVEAVYRELLKTYKPQNIGIYGCSAGGALTGQAAAWIASRGLPAPGALGILCSGLMPRFWYGGDSDTLTRLANPPFSVGSGGAPKIRAYMEGADPADGRAVPGPHPEVLAKFPPTLFISGTRDVALSNVLVTNGKLQAAGVRTTLLVQEGMGHADMVSFVGAPEAQTAWDTAWRFFDGALGR